MARARTINLLGALVVGLADEINRELQGILGLAGSAPAAVISVGTRPGQTIADLSAVLRLSHSATVRLVERLQAAGAIRRQEADDKRYVLLSLSARGKDLFARMLARRRKVLGDRLSALNVAERRELTSFLAALLHELPTDREQARNICRLCEHSVCRGKSCPVGTRFAGE